MPIRPEECIRRIAPVILPSSIICRTSTRPKSFSEPCNRRLFVVMLFPCFQSEIPRLYAIGIYLMAFLKSSSCVSDIIASLNLFQQVSYLQIQHKFCRAAKLPLVYSEAKLMFRLETRQNFSRFSF